MSLSHIPKGAVRRTTEHAMSEIVCWVTVCSVSSAVSSAGSVTNSFLFFCYFSVNGEAFSAPQFMVSSLLSLEIFRSSMRLLFFSTSTFTFVSLNSRTVANYNNDTTITITTTNATTTITTTTASAAAATTTITTTTTTSGFHMDTEY